MSGGKGTSSITSSTSNSSRLAGSDRSSPHFPPLIPTRLSLCLAAKTVVEVYAGWAGSCKPVASTLRSLSHALSDGSIKFLQANSDTVAAQALEPYRARCQPVFLLYKVSVACVHAGSTVCCQGGPLAKPCRQGKCVLTSCAPRLPATPHRAASCARRW